MVIGFMSIHEDILQGGGGNMYDVSGFIAKHKKAIVTGTISLVCVLVFFCTGYMLGIRNTGRSDTSSLSVGAEQVRQHIQSAIAEQREITERINRQQDSAAQITDRLAESATGIETAALATGRAASLVDESGKLIAEGQRILAKVRARGKENQATN